MEDYARLFMTPLERKVSLFVQRNVVKRGNYSNITLLIGRGTYHALLD
jgi:hypothetical protein